MQERHRRIRKSMSTRHPFPNLKASRSDQLQRLENVAWKLGYVTMTESLEYLSDDFIRKWPKWVNGSALDNQSTRSWHMATPPSSDQYDSSHFSSAFLTRDDGDNSAFKLDSEYKRRGNLTPLPRYTPSSPISE